MNQVILSNSLWRRKTLDGTSYRVSFLTNEINSPEFPLTVVYESLLTRKVYSMLHKDFVAQMEAVMGKDPEERTKSARTVQGATASAHRADCPCTKCFQEREASHVRS